MPDFETQLSGNDLRSVGNVSTVILQVKHQADFDELFKLLYNADRVLAMRAADAIEKITLLQTAYLQKHADALIDLSCQTDHKELMWHLALMFPRVTYKKDDQLVVNMRLMAWVKDKSLSKIVRVNALEALFELAEKELFSKHTLKKIMQQVETEHIPSLDARIKKILAKLPECKGGGDCSCCAQ